MAAAVHPPRIVHQDTPTSSPKDVKKPLMKQEADASRHASPHQSTQGSRQNSPPQPVQPPEAAPATTAEDTKTETTGTSNAQPLGPPPKPAASGADLDYFSGQHGTAFQAESNPFENAFGGASADTPGKSLLPPVASLTSPSTLLPGGTPGWPDSLRGGPLSPAMLQGPSGGADYFGQNFRGSFPTPNESSLRTGLTPGGGGSMFPAPSPNSQLMGLLGSGGITPSFSDFHRTAVSAAAKQNQTNNVTSNGQSHNPDANNQFAQEESKAAAQMPNTSQASDPFSQQGANEAAYGLHMLTQAATGRNGNYGGMQNQPSNLQTNVGVMGGQSQDTSPLSRRGNNKNSIGSMNSGSAENGSDSGESEQNKPATRSRGGKKGAAANGKAANNRRKAEDTPAKTPASKKARANSGGVMPPDDMDDEDDDDMGQMDVDANGRKMTDEEKRKNFLERNRVAALKCRQRKKQWLQNLQNKVEIYSAENDALSSQVQGLREEIVNLKTLLLAHKDCPVAGQQGLAGVNMHTFLEQGNHPHANPYGLGMPNGMGMPGMGMGGPMQQPQRT